MDTIFFEAKVMWSMVDANMHLRHSAYADFAAQARLEMMAKMNFGPAELKELLVGPILFREELIYLKEVRMDDTVQVTCALSKCRADGSRWSFVQNIFRADGVQAALINVDGAWIDMVKRKLASLPKDIVDQFLTMPKTEDFILEEIPLK